MPQLQFQFLRYNLNFGNHNEHSIMSAQHFGCAAGGPPNCVVDGAKGKLLCDGEVLSLKKLAAARVSGECVCENGVTPVCDNTGDIPKCWDGSSPNPDLGAVTLEHLKKCSPPTA